MDKNQYHYDFSYSIALENTDLALPEDHIERSFMDWCEIFIARRIFKTDDGHSFNTLLLRVPAFRRLGLQMLKLFVLSYGEAVEDKNSGMEKCRQHIYCELQALEKTLGKEKQSYLNIIIISLYAIIQRATEIIANISIQDEFTLFHLIYWELKGQLVNKQKMENIIDKIFVAEEFHRFMYWPKEDLLTYLRQIKPKPKTQQTQPEPLTFRTKTNNTNQNQSHMYQSFKQLSLKSETKMERKENVHFNAYYPSFTDGQNQNLPEVMGIKNEGVKGTFRKKPQFEGACEQAIGIQRPGLNKNRNFESKMNERVKRDQLLVCGEMKGKDFLGQAQERLKQFQFQMGQNRRATMF